MTEKEVLSAMGPGAPTLLKRHKLGREGAMDAVPSISCVMSEGASLSFTVEVSREQAEPRTWRALDYPSINMKASSLRALGFLAAAIRVNVTSYGSGSLTVEVREP